MPTPEQIALAQALMQGATQQPVDNTARQLASGLAEYGSPRWQAEHAARLVPTGDFPALDAQMGGEFGRGNISLNGRMVHRLNDKQYSSLESMSFNHDGKEVLVPMIDDYGNLMSQDQAKNLYLQTGKHLGKFDAPEDADKYAIGLERRQQAYYENGPGAEILGASQPFTFADLAKKRGFR